jgi:sec-independent protein translocase protein TatB
VFEIGLPELVILAVVSLLVLGPERLPRAARLAGLWVRRARAQWYSLRAEFERELQAREGLEQDIRAPFDEARALLDEGARKLQDAGEQAGRALETADPERPQGAGPDDRPPP